MKKIERYTKFAATLNNIQRAVTNNQDKLQYNTEMLKMFNLFVTKSIYSK